MTSSNALQSGAVAAVAQQGGIGRYEWTPATRELLWDDVLASVFVADRLEERPFETWLRRVHPDDKDRGIAAFTELQQAEDSYRLVFDDGSIRHVSSRATQIVHDDSGMPVRMIGVMIDVTTGHEADDRSGDMLESISDGFLSLDREFKFLYVNTRAELLLGAERSVLLGKSLFEAFPQARGTRFETAYTQAMLERVSVCFEEFYCEPLHVWVEVNAQPSSDGIVIYFQDVTSRRKPAQEQQHLIEAERTAHRDAEAVRTQLAQQAAHDPLTGLLTRGGLAAQARQRCGRDVATVLILGVDRFKLINDSLGHAVGDAVLIVIARRLSRALRTGDLLARLDGDQFAVHLITHDAAEAEAVARRLLDAVRAPVQIHEQTLAITASIGLVAAARGASFDTMLRNADVALSRSKDAGRNRLAWFDAHADAAHLDRIALVADLREAITDGQLVLHYQPKLDITRDAVVGVEALVRWQHPTRGLLHPDVFIELAEQNGLMKPLTLSVLDQALAQSARWRTDGLDLAVAVNVSPSNLMDLALPKQVGDLLHRYGLPTSVLTLEVTEAILMQERETAMTVLTRLRGAGVSISIDDYGTGYSSLAYLAQLPVTELKLDRSFVSRIVGDAGVAAIVRSTVDLAHALGLVLVAEGVEDEASLVLLASFACDVAQGYHLSSPLPADSLTAWLHTRQERPSNGPASVLPPDPREPPGLEHLPDPAQVAAAHATNVPTLGHDVRFLPSLLFAAAGIGVILASRLLPDGPQLVLLSVMQVVGAVAVLIGVRRHRPARPAAWLALAAGGFLFGAGVACWFAYVVLLQQPIPYPGWPDLFFVPAFLSYLTGLLIMIGRRAPARQTQALLDALILAVGLAFANWVFLTGSVIGTATPTPQFVIQVVYPLIDVATVGVVARLLLTGALSPALWLVAAGMLANLVGDTAYSWLAATGGYEVGAVPDQMWMLAMVLVGAAALHPSMRSLVTQVEDTRVSASRLRLLLLFVSLHVPVVVLAVSLFIPGDPHPLAVVLTFAITGPLTALRIQHLTAQLRTLSMSDKLTGLVNRELLIERLDRRRHQRHANGQSVVLFIDLDRFKAVNDTFGHQVGDDVLILASKRLQRLTSARDTVSRLGGDEFVIVVDHVHELEQVASLAQCIVDSLAEPFHVREHEVFIGASVGVTTLDDTDSATVLHRGDTAMYHAKASGRSGWAQYTPELAPLDRPSENLPTQARTRADARVRGS